MYVTHVYHTGMTVARVHLNKLTQEAYSECFRAVFSSVTKQHPSFAVGRSLVGILMDWSDQRFNGLEQVVGRDVAEAVVKGCQVCNHLTVVQTVLLCFFLFFYTVNVHYTCTYI